LLPDHDTLYSFNLFAQPLGMAVDTANNRILVTNHGAVIAVDLTTGKRNQVSGTYEQGLANMLYDSTDIAVDSENGIAFVTDTTLNAVVAVYLKNGDRVILSK